MNPVPCFLRLVLAVATLTAVRADPLAEVKLWPGDAPGSEGRHEPEEVVTASNGERTVTAVHQPSLTPYLPKDGTATGAAVLVIPGGGHSKLCVDHEGSFVAQWLADHGIAAFVLKHRLAREEGSTYTIKDHAVPDARRALRLIRARAAEWGVVPERVGAIGFSAGGELVAQIAMDPQDTPAAADAIDRLSARPAFQGLIYPGRSGDIQPAAGQPPAFLACGEKDRPDISEGLAETYLRFKRAGVSAELHVYAATGHGFGLRPTATGPAAHWPDRFREWLAAGGLLK